MRRVIEENRLRNLEALGGALCLFGGVLAALLGCLLSLGLWFIGAELHPWLRVSGTALFVVAIPLILFAGFCLDWAERNPNKANPPEDQDTHRGAVDWSCLVALAVFSLGALLLPPRIHAQQTIFNVPATDVLDKGKVYAELDVSLKPTDGAVVNRFSSFVPRA